MSDSDLCERPAGPETSRNRSSLTAESADQVVHSGGHKFPPVFLRNSCCSAVFAQSQHGGRESNSLRHLRDLDIGLFARDRALLRFPGIHLAQFAGELFRAVGPQNCISVVRWRRRLCAADCALLLDLPQSAAFVRRQGQRTSTSMLGSKCCRSGSDELPHAENWMRCRYLIGVGKVGGAPVEPATDCLQ